jgi:hypothetical protein
VLPKVNTALKKANSSQFSGPAEHHIMVLAPTMEYAVTGRWRHLFAFDRRQTPRPLGALQALEP